MATVIRPDKQFIDDVIRNGGDSVKKCFQCANCTAVCELSSGDAPFPRKQMHMAQWGMKDKLAADPAVWYCHLCRDCSTHCPRNAKPADVLAAVRLSLIKHFSVPGFMGKFMSEKKYLPVVFAIPVVFMLIMLRVAGSFSFPAGEVHYAEWLPHIVLELMFSAAFFIGLFATIAGALKFWKAIDSAEPGDRSKGDGLVPAVINTFVELIAHNRFRKCNQNSLFAWVHMLILLGFIGLFITTGIVVLFVILDLGYPLPLLHPLKILGNVSGLSFILGLFGAIYLRLTEKSDTQNAASYADWLFLSILSGVAITGFGTETFRYTNLVALAYPTYFVHMVFNFLLLVFLPYTKFAHLFYRFLALVHARMTGRSLDMVTEQVSPTVAVENASTEAAAS